MKLAVLGIDEALTSAATLDVGAELTQLNRVIGQLTLTGSKGAITYESGSCTYGFRC